MSICSSQRAITWADLLGSPDFALLRFRDQRKCDWTSFWEAPWRATLDAYKSVLGESKFLCVLGRTKLGDQGSSESGAREQRPVRLSAEDRLLQELLDSIETNLVRQRALLAALSRSTHEDRSPHPPPPPSNALPHLRLAWSRPDGDLAVRPAPPQPQDQLASLADWHMVRTSQAQSAVSAEPRPHATAGRRQIERTGAREDARIITERGEPSPIATARRVKARRSSASIAWRVGAILAMLAIAVATGAGLVMISQKSDPKVLKGQRLSISEYTSRHRHATTAQAPPPSSAAEPPRLGVLNQSEQVVEDRHVRDEEPPAIVEQGKQGVAKGPIVSPTAIPDVVHRSTPRVPVEDSASASAPIIASETTALIPKEAGQGRAASEPSPTLSEPSPTLEVLTPQPPPLPTRRPASIRPRVASSEKPAAAEHQTVAADWPVAMSSEQRFTPALILVKNPAAALQVFESVRQRHAAVLNGRTPEVRPVVLANKETWYQVILQPPGTRSDAEHLCQKLGSEGKALGCSAVSNTR